MDIPVRACKFRRSASWALAALISMVALSNATQAQSIDITSPTPVRTDEVLGTIAPRDLGDPRLTDHFYAFTGTPGDVVITVEASNLNGDVDVFTTAGLRPLLKFTIYSGSSSPTMKSIYLRTRVDLLLRVEGRTPNDDNGTYKIHFGGSFEPITSGPLLAESDNASSQPATPPVVPAPKSRTGKKGRRVSAVGARIEEPPSTDVAAVPTPEPSPSESVEPVPPPKAKSRNSRTRRPANRRTRASDTEKKEEAAAKIETGTDPMSEGADTEVKPTRTTKRSTKRSTTARAATPATKPEPQETGPKLIIETDEGTLVDRYMTSVRRVTVENGQVVVVGKDGKVQRIQLASVVRMTITP